MMSDGEKPRLQKMTGMLVAEMGNILAAEAHADRQTASWATPLKNRLETLVDYVTDGLHEALLRNCGEIPVSKKPAETMATIAAGKIATGLDEPLLVGKLQADFEEYFLEDIIEDVPQEGRLTEDQLDRLAFVAAMSASWWCFVEPLQSRIAEELRQNRGIIDPLQ